MKWKTYRLGDCVTFLSGGTPSKKKPEYWNGGIPWISCKDMKVDYLYDSQDYITDTGSKNGTRLVPERTVLIVVRGMILAQHFPVAITKRSLAFNQDLKALECSSKIDSIYLFHWLRGKSYEILGIADEAAHGTKRLQTDRLQNFPIDLPPLPTQHKIASILSTYDDLIENNTRRIKILESMAQTLYQEWFVKFRFPGHKQVNMVESELGLIPEGWLGKLEDALILQRGFDLPIKKRKQGNVPVYASTGITGTHNEAKIKAPGVVTGRSGSLGTVMYVDENFWALNTTLWVREFRKVTPIYAFYLLSSLGLEQYNSGAAVPSLNRNNVHGLPVVIPNSSILEQFDDYVEPLFQLKKSLQRKNINLCKTRDLLLPKLISGQIDVENLDIDTGELAA